MPAREIPEFCEGDGTRSKILKEAVRFFALKGFDGTSVKDIAKAVGIKTSSIYNYYESKETLLQDILACFEKRYWHYFDWLSKENAAAETLEQLVNNMINEEVIDMADPLGCFAISFILKEQHKNPAIRKYVFEFFWDHSIRSLKSDLDKAIERGLMPQCDTKIIAQTLLFNVLAVNDLRLHEYAGARALIDSKEIYRGIKKLLLILLSQG